MRKKQPSVDAEVMKCSEQSEERRPLFTARNGQKVTQVQQDIMQRLQQEANAELEAALEAARTTPSPITQQTALKMQQQAQAQVAALQQLNTLPTATHIAREQQALQQARQQQLDHLMQMQLAQAHQHAIMQQLMQPPLPSYSPTINSLGYTPYVQQQSAKPPQAPTPAPVKKQEQNLPRTIKFEA